ncbi:MAG: AAA family ATPase [Epsilonproteobacteria bacterium]|nr:AAA family ATPase [Campylobacterota bacterium]
MLSFIVGKEGERVVLDKLSKNLKAKGEDFILIPNVALKILGSNEDVDLLLIHPTLGIYIIEVKNYKSIDELKLKNPFKQANEYQDNLLSILSKNGLNTAMNVEYRVVFPKIRKKEGKEGLKAYGFDGYEYNAVFKEDLEDLDNFFYATQPMVPTENELKKIVSLLVPANEQKEILPIIKSDGVFYFDNKQLSVLSKYRGGLRIIRGVAGSGKSMILINFIKANPKSKFLVLCFNKKLKDFLKKELKGFNADVYTLFGFLNEVGFEFEGKKVGVCPKCEGDLVVRKGKNLFVGCANFPKCRFSRELSLEDKYKILENSIEELKEKIAPFVKQYDYFLADETQDLSAAVVRILIDEVKNSILFIDEAQKIYPYTLKDIRDVLYHPKFAPLKVSVENFINLRNIYRTPSNTARAALEILSKDKEIDEFYKKVRFISSIDDVRLILEEGDFYVGNFNELDELKELVEKIKGEKIILSFDKNDVDEIEKNIPNIKTMPMMAVKGLEAENVIIHNFEEFLNVASKNAEFYRQLYVLLTRSKKNIYLSINPKELKENEKIKEVVEILNSYSNTTMENIVLKSKSYKEVDEEKVDKYTNYLIKGVELLAAFAGFWSA